MEYFNNLGKAYQKELLELIKEELEHNCLETDTIGEKYFCVSDFHHKLFNEDYHFIYTYDCIQFIESEFNSAFEAIEIVKDWEQSNFGTFDTSIDAFNIANMLIYIIGEDLIYNVLNIEDEATAKEILNNIEELLS
jgi:hypothetical protein